MKKKELKFDEYSKKALVIMQNTFKNLYLTWKAGSWKSTILNFFTSKTKKKFLLLGTTGISAINIWWVTIHSFFWITPKLKVKTMSKEKIEFIRQLDTIIIDEVSMLRADLFDVLNLLMQKIMGNNLFMWWKQFIFVWDLCLRIIRYADSGKERFCKARSDWREVFCRCIHSVQSVKLAW